METGYEARSILRTQTNMFMTALADFLLGAKLYRFERCVTSRILIAEPWFADTMSRGTRWERGSVECAGFSITVPNWAKEDWVRSSMGMRMDGQGIEGGMVP